MEKLTEIIESCKKDLLKDKSLESVTMVYGKDYLENGQEIQIQIIVTVESDNFL